MLELDRPPVDCLLLLLINELCKKVEVDVSSLDKLLVEVKLAWEIVDVPREVEKGDGCVVDATELAEDD